MSDLPIRRWVIGVLVLCSAVAVVSAQSPPQNASLVGSWDGYSGLYADIWADEDYAYAPCFGCSDTARVFILDIADPANPVLDETFLVPSPNEFSSPQDVKTGDGLLFIGLESDPNGSVSIVDIRDPADRQEIAVVDIAGFTGIHNVFYDNGFLYMSDSSTPRVGILDLTSFDPDNPPAGPITSLTWLLENVGTVFVHDITVQDGRLYAAAWDSGLWIYDVTNVATTIPNVIGTTPGNNTHAMWPTDDGNFVVTGEERGSGGIKVYSITDDGGSLTLEQTDGLVSSEAYSTHNQVVVGNRVYVSWYQAGLQVYDINCEGKLDFVASYDTSAFDGGSVGFQGNWGVYPFNGEDQIVLSDLEEGIFIVDIDGPALSFCLNSIPTVIDPDAGGVVQVTITAAGDEPDPDTAELVYAIDGGTAQSVAMIHDGDVYTGLLPGAPCGSTVDYYVTIDSVGGTTQTSPANAPSTTFSALSTSGIVAIAVEDFESPVGWSVSGDALEGVWESGVPAGDGTRGDPTVDYDGSGACYLTQNGAGNTDVDTGTTILTSPQYDISGLNDPRIEYSRWFSNVEGGAPEEDVFVVEASSNGSTWLNVETVGPSGPGVQGGWIPVSIEVPAALVGTSTLQVRFSASDLGNGSVVEAAVDAFRIGDLDCENICTTDPPDCSSLDGDCAIGVCNPEDGSCVQQMLTDIVCRPAVGECDVAELCDGQAASCPADDTISAGTPCDSGGGPGSGECDGAGACNAIAAGCQSIADCADTDDDGIRDDGCVFWDCVANACQSTDIVFADMAGAFGACPPDGTADGNDNFAALNCFANVDPDGKGGFPCEDMPPQAFNVDAGGSFGSCDPDGVCDGNDAFAALNAFGGVTSCTCPLGGPAPIAPRAPVVGQATLTLSSKHGAVQPTGTIAVTVSLAQGLADLRGYQLHVGVAGGTSGRLELIDIIADNTAQDFDWSAFNLDMQQVLVGRSGPGQARKPGPLATFVFKASPDAAGRFAIELLHDHDDPQQRSFLFATAPTARLAIESTVLEIDVTAGRKLRRR